MTRNSGKDIDPVAKRVRDRDGKWHDVDELQVAGPVLYYGRSLGSWPAMQFDYHEMWAFADLDVTVSRLRFFPDAPDAIDWYIETDPIDIVGGTWHIRDGFLDVCVYEGSRYRVEDAEELADGLTAGTISVEHASRALRALERVLRGLDANGCSGAELLRGWTPEFAEKRLPR